MDGTENNQIITIRVGSETFTTFTGTLRLLPGTLLADIVDYYYQGDDSDVCLKPANHYQCTSPSKRMGSSYLSKAAEDTNTDPLQISQENHVNTTRPSPDRWKYVHFLPRTSSDMEKESDANGNRRYSNGTNSNTSSRSSLSPILFIDRNPILMPYILDSYRSGELHLPRDVCSLLIRSELAFWGFSEDMISECCWKSFHEGLNSVRIIGVIHKTLFDKYDVKERRDSLSWFQKIWLSMERPSFNLAAKVWCTIYYMVITASILIFVLSTVSQFLTISDEFIDQYNEAIASNATIGWVRYLSFFVQVKGLTITTYVIQCFFTVEFAVRLATTPDRSAFTRDTHNIIDMTILGITWLKFVLNHSFLDASEDFGVVQSHANIIIGCLTSAQVLRIGHLFKHMASLKLMYLSAKESMAELLLLVVVVGVAVILFGTALFLAEALSATDGDLSFKNVPIAMWWAIITMTTVGYGDFVPKNTAGYLIGVICALTGLLLVAMPIAIIARNFSDFYETLTSRDQLLRRQEFRKKYPLQKTLEGGGEQCLGHLESKVNKGMEYSDDDVSVKVISSNGIDRVSVLDAIEMRNHVQKDGKFKPRVHRTNTCSTLLGHSDPNLVTCWT